MRAAGLALTCALLAAGCKSPFERSSYLGGLRILAVKAVPPEVAPGATSTLTALTVAPAGDPVAISWVECRVPALVGSGEGLSANCLTADAADGLTPVGTGGSVSVVMPDLGPDAVGTPDYTGGVYLPILLLASAGGDETAGVYRLRRAGGGPPNRNPRITEVGVVENTGAVTLLAEDRPSETSAGAGLTLVMTVSADSRETYTAPDGAGGTRAVPEVLRVSWFATGGRLVAGNVGVDDSDHAFTWFVLDQHLPAVGPSGGRIDLYVVVRDERGGADFAHRQLVLR
ncbi:MAG TPA: hypothetical protein VGQ83_04330 [Polyangia bacterium]|jgi:hypothetical protein